MVFKLPSSENLSTKPMIKCERETSDNLSMPVSKNVVIFAFVLASLMVETDFDFVSFSLKSVLFKINVRKMTHNKTLMVNNTSRENGNNSFEHVLIEY